MTTIVTPILRESDELETASDQKWNLNIFQYGAVVRIARTIGSHRGLDSQAMLIKLQACWQKLLLAEAPARPQKHLHHEMCARSAQSLGGVEGARCAWLPSRGVLGSLCD